MKHFCITPIFDGLGSSQGLGDLSQMREKGKRARVRPQFQQPYWDSRANVILPEERVAPIIGQEGGKM